jgi:mono/diheme cytochrome c family protein
VIHKFTLLPVVLLALVAADCSRKPPPPAPGPTATAHDSTGAPAADTAAAKPVDLTYEQAQGKFLYGKYCAVCHGTEGKGDGFNAYNLDTKPRDFTDSSAMHGLSDERIGATVAGGGRSVNRSPLMPSWGGRMNALEIRYVVSYVRFLQGGGH